MPIYEYHCKSCGHDFELMQKMSDHPETHCSACGQETAVRWVSAAGFQLKGTGWYVTDFKDKPKATASESVGQAAAPKSDAPSLKKETDV